MRKGLVSDKISRPALSLAQMKTLNMRLMKKREMPTGVSLGRQ